MAVRATVCGCPALQPCDAAVWHCAAVRQYDERQCVAVRTVDSVRLVHAAVCGSVLGSVWHCARHCAAVRQCNSVRQCGSLCAAVWQRTAGRRCAAMRQCVCGSAAVCA
jgi:hypothetical protein